MLTPDAIVLLGLSPIETQAFRMNQYCRTISGNQPKVTKVYEDGFDLVFYHKGSAYYRRFQKCTFDQLIHLSTDPNIICEDDICFTQNIYLNRRAGFDINVVREAALRSKHMMTRDGHLAKIVSINKVPILQVYGRPNGYLQEVIDQINIDLNTLKVEPMNLIPHKYDIVGIAHKSMMYNKREPV